MFLTGTPRNSTVYCYLRHHGTQYRCNRQPISHFIPPLDCRNFPMPRVHHPEHLAGGYRVRADLCEKTTRRRRVRSPFRGHRKRRRRGLASRRSVPSAPASIGSRAGPSRADDRAWGAGTPGSPRRSGRSPSPSARVFSPPVGRGPVWPVLPRPRRSPAPRSLSVLHRPPTAAAADERLSWGSFPFSASRRRVLAFRRSDRRGSRSARDRSLCRRSRPAGLQTGWAAPVTFPFDHGTR